DGRGKAPVPSPKKILGVPVRGATKGGAIRLYEPRDGRLGIAEGLESALSLGLIRGITVWSSYCAENLAAVCLPPRLAELEGRVMAEALDMLPPSQEAPALQRIPEDTRARLDREARERELPTPCRMSRTGLSCLLTSNPSSADLSPTPVRMPTWRTRCGWPT